MVPTWMCADTAHCSCRERLHKGLPVLLPNQRYRKSQPPIRVDMRWNHLLSLCMFLIDCVSVGMLTLLPRVMCLNVQFCTFNSHGVRLLLCSCLTKASCLTLHTVTGKILCRKPPTPLFTFCSAI